MKVLVVGAGGVGAAFAAIVQRRPAFEQVVLAESRPARHTAREAPFPARRVPPTGPVTP